MSEYQANQGERKESGSASCSSSGSPSTLLTNLTANQAFGCEHYVDADNFEIQNQIHLHNLDQNEKNQDKKHWDLHEEELLLNLHDQLGNKWTDIAHKLINRDHNSVKNHFYAKIRKSLRRLNFFIKKFFHQKIKQLNMCHVSKMITMLSQKNSQQSITVSQYQDVQQIKRFLFMMSEKTEQDRFNQRMLLQIKQGIQKISRLLDSVKKNNFVLKNNKSKQDPPVESKNKVKKELSIWKKPQASSIKGLKTEQNQNERVLNSSPADNNQNCLNDKCWIFMIPSYTHGVNDSNLYVNSGYEWLSMNQQYLYMANTLFLNS